MTGAYSTLARAVGAAGAEEEKTTTTAPGQVTRV